MFVSPFLRVHSMNCPENMFVNALLWTLTLYKMRKPWENIIPLPNGHASVYCLSVNRLMVLGVSSSAI